MKTRQKLAAIFVLTTSIAQLASAATFTSIADGEWNDPSKWDASLSFPDTLLNDNAVVGHIINLNGSGSIPGGALGVGTGKTITINAGGQLTQTIATTDIAIGVAGAGIPNGAGTLNINGGGLFSSDQAAGVAVGVSLDGLGTTTGTVNINEGTFRIGSGLSTGFGIGVNTGGTGIFNVGDAAGAADTAILDLLTNNKEAHIGTASGPGLGAGTGTVLVNTDGRINQGTGTVFVGELGGIGELAILGNYNSNGGLLSIGTGTDSTGQVAVQGGNLTTNKGIHIGMNGGSGTFSLNGGTVSSLETTPNEDLSFIVGQSGSGIAIVQAGTLTVNSMGIGRNSGTGVVSLTGGSIVSNNHINLGVGNGVGTVVQTGGTLNFNTWLAIGLGGGPGTSSYDLQGGTITGGALEVGSDQGGELKIGGTSTVNATVNVGLRSTGNGLVTQTGGTVTGTVVVGGIQQVQTTAVGNYNMTGGSITGRILVGHKGIGNMTVNDAGAVINNNIDFLSVGTHRGAKGTLTLNAGTINVGAWAAIIGNEENYSEGASNSNGFTRQENVLNVHGGLLRMNSFSPSDGADFVVGRFGIGTVNQTAGTVEANGWTMIGTDNGSRGTYNLSGGTFIQQNETMVIGRGITDDNNATPHTLTIAGTGVFNKNSGNIHLGTDSGYGAISLQSGGTMTMNGWLTLGDGGNAKGLYQQSGGTLTANNLIAGQFGRGDVQITGGTATIGQFIIGRETNGRGDLQMNGGTVTANEFKVGEVGGGTGGHGTGNLSGGTITFGEAKFGQGSGTADFEISGGNLVGSSDANRGWVRIGEGRDNTRPNVVRMTNGSFTYNSWFEVGGDGGSIDPSVNKFIITGGTLSGTSHLTAGADHGGTIEIGGTASVTVPEINAGLFHRADNRPGKGVINVSGGTTQINGGVFIGRMEGDNATGANGPAEGTLNISGGTFTQSGGSDTHIGFRRSAIGVADISGGTMTVGTHMYLGTHDSANGTLVVRNTGTLNTGNHLVAGNSGSTSGTINILGGNANIGQDLGLGWGGSATGLYAQTGGTVNVNSWTYIGTGGGSSTGTLDVNGGTLNLHSQLRMGDGNGATANLRVQSGNLNFTMSAPHGGNERNNYIGIGGSSTSHFIVEGGAINFNGGNLYSAWGGDSVGNYTQTGGTVTGNPYVNIAREGTSTWTISAGTFNAGGVDINGGDGDDSGIATLAVSGTGSFLSNQYINVGGDGSQNQTTINQSGGTVSFNSWMTIGIGNGNVDPEKNKYNLSGGTLQGSGVEVGSDRGGTLNVSGTGTVNVNGLYLGHHGRHNQTGNGVMTVSGGTVNAGEIVVANNVQNDPLKPFAQGNITQSGGTIITNSLRIAQASRASGNMDITAGNTTAGEIIIGVSGGGELEQTGGTLTSLGNITLAANGNPENEGTLILDGSSAVLRVDGIFDYDNPNATFIFRNGTLTRTNTGTIQLRGLLTSETSGATLGLGGDKTFNAIGGIDNTLGLSLEVTGRGVADIYTETGDRHTGSIHLGDVSVATVGNWNIPTVSLLGFDAAFLANGVPYTATRINAGDAFSIHDNVYWVRESAGSVDILFNVIPEPTAGLSMLGGLGLLLGLRRRRKA